jgi:hypothetical protein
MLLYPQITELYCFEYLNLDLQHLAVLYIYSSPDLQQHSTQVILIKALVQLMMN